MSSKKMIHRKTLSDLNIPHYNNEVYNTRDCYLLAYNLDDKVFDSMGQLGTKGVYFRGLFLSPNGKVFTYDYNNGSNPTFLDFLCCRHNLWDNEQGIQDFWRGLKDINLYKYKVYLYEEVKGMASNDYYENNPNWKNEWKSASAKADYPISFREEE